MQPPRRGRSTARRPSPWPSTSWKRRLEKSRELVALQQQVAGQPGEGRVRPGARWPSWPPAPAGPERDAVIVVEQRQRRRRQGAAQLPGRCGVVAAAVQAPRRQGRPRSRCRWSTWRPWCSRPARTGANVKLVLSTAQPMLNAAPPDLQSLQRRRRAARPASPAAPSDRRRCWKTQIKKPAQPRPSKDFNEQQAVQRRRPVQHGRRPRSVPRAAQPRRGRPSAAAPWPSAKGRASPIT